MSAPQDDYVAWLTFRKKDGTHSDGRIRICDSDSPGAFKVYRAAPISAVLEGERDESEQTRQFRRSLEDCRMLAARHAHKTGAEWAEHVLRYCAAAGVVGSPLRAPLIACNAGLERDKDGHPVPRRPNKPQGSA